MTIDKIYIANHKGAIDGHDSLGKVKTFEYSGFFDLDELVEKGDRFIKDSGSMIFILKKKEVIHKFDWDCRRTGYLINSDTIKNNINETN